MVGKQLSERLILVLQPVVEFVAFHLDFLLWLTELLQQGVIIHGADVIVPNESHFLVVEFVFNAVCPNVVLLLGAVVVKETKSNSILLVADLRAGPAVLAVLHVVLFNGVLHLEFFPDWIDILKALVGVEVVVFDVEPLGDALVFVAYVLVVALEVVIKVGMQTAPVLRIEGVNV